MKAYQCERLPGSSETTQASRAVGRKRRQDTSSALTVSNNLAVGHLRLYGLSKILLPCCISDISLTMNDLKAIATIFFRVFGVSNLIYSVLYWLYGMFTNLFEPQSRFIVTTLWAFTYLALGLLLVLFSKRLAAVVVKGLNKGTLQNPPLPPSFPPNVQQ